MLKLEGQWLAWILIALAGCGGGSGGGGADGGGDTSGTGEGLIACEVLSEDDVNAVLGSELRSTDASDDGLSACYYDPWDIPQPTAAGLILDFNNDDGLESVLHGYRVGGVGEIEEFSLRGYDAAYVFYVEEELSEGSRDTGNVFVQVGDLFIHVGILSTTLTKEQMRDHGVAMAELVLDAL